MDYAVAPDGPNVKDEQDDRLRAMFERRTDTSLIYRPQVSSVGAFVRHLDTTVTQRPVGDLLIGTHANAMGWLQVPLYAGQKGDSSYEVIEAALRDPANPIAIPDNLIGYTEGEPLTHSVHLKGCNIGKATKFLTKLKQGFGGHVGVTAPVHYHGLYTIAGVGVIEHMAYEFVVRRPTAFANRAEAVADFRAGGFTFIDGSAVPDEKWDEWIPASGRLDKKITPKVVHPDLGVDLQGNTTADVERQFRVDHDRYRNTVVFTFPSAAAVPKDKAAQMQRLEQDLRSDELLKPTHDYPDYERLGYPDFDAFFAGFRWTCTPSGRKLTCRGERLRYTVLVPITNPGTGNLIFNFYPDAGPSTVEPGLKIDDTRYFATV